MFGYFKNIKLIREDKMRDTEKERKIFHISNRAFLYNNDVYVPDGHKTLGFFPSSDYYDFDYVAERFFLRSKLLSKCVIIRLRSWENNKKITNYNFEQIIAKSIFDSCNKHHNTSCFFGEYVEHYETYICLNNNLDEILDEINRFCGGFYFTIYVYDYNEIEFFTHKDIQEYINKQRYLISYTFEMQHDLLSIAFDENYISYENIISDLRMVCDELDLVLEVK